MSNFNVLIQPIFIKPHLNADALEIGNIGSKDGWQVVVKKGLYKTGDHVAYIGENAVVPEEVLKKYGFWNEEKSKGLLAGSKGDKVKAVRLRNEFSLGICIPVHEICQDVIDEETNMYFLILEGKYVEVGENVANLLGVIKYEAPIPIALAGEVYNAGTSIGVNYDIEDMKNFLEVFEEGEEVQVTAKLHGSLCQLVYINKSEVQDQDTEHLLIDDIGYLAISSKGLGGKGLFLKHNEKNINNAYIRATKKYWSDLIRFSKICGGNTVTIVGEVFGDGIQDFNYGLKNQIDFRVFDVYIGNRGIGRYLDDKELDEFCLGAKLQRVPIVYRGPYSMDLMMKFANEPETGLPGVTHIREGVVFKPIIERRDPVLGRIVLKTRSEAYMTRKGGTEHN